MIKADCWTCAESRSLDLKAKGRASEAMSFGMYLCSECGNKRCPRATDHTLECGHSNESGQPGSRYAAFDPDRPRKTVAEMLEMLENS